MRTKDRTAAPYPDLKTLEFTANIDFLTVFTPHKLRLPPLAGKPEWSPKYNWTRLSVHDPKRVDIVGLIDFLGPLRLVALEVCVDVSCSAVIPREQRDVHLQSVLVDMFARGLDPVDNGLIGPFRAGYRFGLTPFNLRLPAPTEQLLYGHKSDPAQVKCYHKTSDRGAALSDKDQVARVEVALRHDGLQAHGLRTVDDLLGFRYRKELSPYFRHVRAVSRRELGRPSLRPSWRLLAERGQDDLISEFGRVGVGSVKRGGKFAHKEIRAHRDIPVNKRIGEALGRLERAMWPEIRAPIGPVAAS